MKKNLIVVAVLAVLLGAVMLVHRVIAEPAREAAHNLAAINGLTVGKTTEAELLTRKEFQTAERTCHEANCRYLMDTVNTFLSKLHLAPQIHITTIVAVRDGLVMEVTAFAFTPEKPAISIKQVMQMPPGCSSVPCVVRLARPDKTLLGISILLNSDSAIRNRLPEAVNSRCLSQLHGCSSFTELMPVAKDLHLETAERQ